MKTHHIMSVRERGFLGLKSGRVRVERPKEIAEICVACPGNCKAAVGLTRCPGRERFSKR